MMFQSTHPRRVWRQGSLSGSTKVCKFQSTHPRRVWPVCPEYYRTRRWFQSTHPRRVWRRVALVLVHQSDVSIHTPTQGVTGGWGDNRHAGAVSIHTPTQGVTVKRDCFSRIEVFQSTHPRRVWLIPNPQISRCMVSIHTPTQGVTALDKRLRNMYPVSIHTPTQGVTSVNPNAAANCLFQSTHPRRVWQPNGEDNFNFDCFNPHTHAGCDSGWFTVGKRKTMFQSTHPRRVWPCFAFIYSSRMVSIHTPTQGVTAIRYGDSIIIGFQSTHPRRVWHRVFKDKHGRYSFNPHTHAGCDH